MGGPTKFILFKVKKGCLDTEIKDVAQTKNDETRSEKIIYPNRKKKKNLVNWNILVTKEKINQEFKSSGERNWIKFNEKVKLQEKPIRVIVP